MMRETHEPLGAACGIGFGIVAAQAADWSQAHPAAAAVYPLLAGVLATLTSMGPDIDNARWWLRMFGGNGPLGHRRLMHWWGTPIVYVVLMGAVLSMIGSILGQPVAASAALGWPLWAPLLVGWYSHLLGDWAFGKSGYGRAAGIPLMPWWAYSGFGRLKVGKGMERWTRRGLWAAVIPALAGLALVTA